MDVESWPPGEDESVVMDYVSTLPAKTQKKIVRTLGLLEKYGRDFLLFNTKYLKKLRGYELYEIRIEWEKVCYRILCLIVKTTCWLLHIFVKKSNKTPKREINIAIDRAKKLSIFLNTN